MIFMVNSILVTEGIGCWTQKKNISYISNKEKVWRQAYKYLTDTDWKYGMGKVGKT